MTIHGFFASCMASPWDCGAFQGFDEWGALADCISGLELDLLGNLDAHASSTSAANNLAASPAPTAARVDGAKPGGGPASPINPMK